MGQTELKCSLEKQLCLSEESNWQKIFKVQRELPRTKDSRAVRACVFREDACLLVNTSLLGVSHSILTCNRTLWEEM